MDTPITLKNFINGKFEEFNEKNSIDQISYEDVINPANNQIIAKVPLSNQATLQRAVDAGKKAFEVWSNLTIKQRASIMLKFHYLVDSHSQELAELIVKENGKNKSEALADIAKGLETVEYAISLPQLSAGRILTVSSNITCQDNRVPLGIVGAIVPFNFPFMVPMWTIPISLVMGNCVILKPSEKVPLTMNRVIDFLVEAGLPSGVFQIVHGSVEIVNALCDHPDISAISFVGSSKVAEIVSKRCHNVNKRVLALGGAKNHLVALDDCNIDMTTRDVIASFAGCTGQRCMAASVLLIVGDHPTLLENIVEQAKKLRLGQDAGEIGPLIDDTAKTRVIKYINQADAQGSKILLDGRKLTRDSGNWVGPTIILHTNPHDPAMQDEIFGPVLSVYHVNTFDEAIAIENSNPHGNAACIYTEHAGNADYFIKRFRSAMLGVNVGIPVPREPFSFGGLYGTKSKFGDVDITGDGAMDFFSNRIKVTTKWSNNKVINGNDQLTHKKPKYEDKANFNGNI